MLIRWVFWNGPPHPSWTTVLTQRTPPPLPVGTAHPQRIKKTSSIPISSYRRSCRISGKILKKLDPSRESTPADSHLAQLVHSISFEICCTIIIMANAATMVYSANYMMVELSARRDPSTPISGYTQLSLQQIVYTTRASPTPGQRPGARGHRSEARGQMSEVKFEENVCVANPLPSP